MDSTMNPKVKTKEKELDMFSGSEHLGVEEHAEAS
jgi:hypothetical protein